MRSINENLDNPAVAKAIALSLRTYLQFAIGDLGKQHVTDIAYADDPATKAFIEVCDEDDAPKPQVKPLIWENPSIDNNHLYISRTFYGNYYVHIDGGRHRSWLETNVKPYEEWCGDEDVGSVIEAQRAAQMHHRELALSMLVAA